MNQKLRTYIESLFVDAPKNKKTVELKEEMVQNLIDKYNDLISEGKSEDAAYNIAVASVGDISDLINELNKGTSASSELEEKERRRSALLTAISVGIYILSIIPVLIWQDETGVILMFTLAAVATVIIVYNAMTKPKYHKLDDTLVEEFKEWKASSNESDKMLKAISGSLWLLTVAIYIVISFLTGAWHITWIIFLIAGAVNTIIKALFDLKK